MRGLSSCLLLALSAHVSAHPFSPHLQARAATTTTSKYYPIVNVDGPDGDAGPPTVTVTKHAPTATVTHRVTDTIVHTKHQPTTVISVVPVDGKPDEKDGQPEPVTVTVWESDSSSSAVSSSTTTTTTTTTSRPAVVDPEPEPTPDIIRPPPPSSSESSQTTSSQIISSESSSVGPSESTTDVYSSSFVPQPSTTTTTSYTIESESSVVPIPSPISLPAPERPGPEPEQTTTSTASVESSPVPDAWVPAPPSSVSEEPTVTSSVEVAPSNVGDWSPPAPERPAESSAIEASSVFSSWVAIPTTFSTATLSITSSPIPETTSTHVPDDGLWHSSKYPSWNTTSVAGGSE